MSLLKRLKQLNLYRLLYLNEDFYEEARKIPTIEPIQIVVFKSVQVDGVDKFVRD